MELLQKQLADNERQHDQLLRLIKAERVRGDVQAGKDLLSFLEKNLGQCKVKHIEATWHDPWFAISKIGDDSDSVFHLETNNTATWSASWKSQRVYDCHAEDVKRLQELVKRKNETEWL